jgi:predicted CopG family antitoxin
VASKNVALAEDAYRLLASHKKPGESFSDVVRRLAGRPNPMDFIGAWKDIPPKEIAEMKRTLQKERRLADEKLKRKLARWDKRWPS